ncbi:hypothetical protein [Amycolatopsis sp. H20-H5]|uniref:hypothetical protein n=1 Tax=Amycolatopsis sp. H20-H5 TaxID=3046309 RepID=UPI002DBA01E4|nr:hypothetical protein [Amycolatopsis sp. H20-H5]MEC3977890.1 hypothetical protein [Amycolatopsis sp. H20-H5]
MMLRRRFATRAELVALLAEDRDEQLVADVVDHLAVVGVPVEALAEIDAVESGG